MTNLEPAISIDPQTMECSFIGAAADLAERYQRYLPEYIDGVTDWTFKWNSRTGVYTFERVHLSHNHDTRIIFISATPWESLYRGITVNVVVDEKHIFGTLIPFPLLPEESIRQTARRYLEVMASFLSFLDIPSI